jgi:hypothetical protein
MQERIEPRSELVVARREAPELFEPIEESLDEVSRFVAVPVGMNRPGYRGGSNS